MELIFQEGDYIVKMLDTYEEFDAALKLRHDVFREELKWVPPSPDGLDKDEYDSYAQSIGIFDSAHELLGNVRLIQAPAPFMIEKEFACLLTEDEHFTKKSDSAEVTRYCVKKSHRHRRFLACISNLIYKGLYQWNIYHSIRHSIMVVDDRCYRLLRLSGLPVRSKGDFLTMPDGVKAAICTLDWLEFEKIAAVNKPGFLTWMGTISNRSSAQLQGHAIC